MALDIDQLRQFTPLADLSEANLHDLAERTTVELIAANKTLFKRGDLDRKSFYLLQGQILLLNENGEKEVIVGGSAAARLPLDPHTPRQKSALTQSEVQFFQIDPNYLDLLLSWEQDPSAQRYQVEEIDTQSYDDEDWMTHLLQSELVHRIPPNHIQMLFTRMEPVAFAAGEVVIRQGDEGDYYYYIKKGRCVVTLSGKSGKQIKLAELQTGRGFGEEALISNNKRNASVSMLTDGVLMRLSKADFEDLLKAPVLHFTPFPEAREAIKNGTAQLIDVRLESEFKQFNFKGSLNIPLYLLRIKARELDHQRPILTLCDNGKRSAAAAFLLNERGFDARYIEGGLLQIKALIQKGH